MPTKDTEMCNVRDSEQFCFQGISNRTQPQEKGVGMADNAGESAVVSVGTSSTSNQRPKIHPPPSIEWRSGDFRKITTDKGHLFVEALHEIIFLAGLLEPVPPAKVL